MACAPRQTPLTGAWLPATHAQRAGCRKPASNPPQGADQGLAFSPADNCSLGGPSSLQPDTRLLMLGDSTVRYQFDAILSWLRRSGATVHCKPAKPPTWSDPMLAESAYDNLPVDCSSPTRGFAAARMLNLLPGAGARGAAQFYDEMFAPAGPNGVVVLSAGPWYGVKRRRKSPAEAAAELQADFAALQRLACARGAAWPRLLWREQLPQHFEGGGAYRGKVTKACAPLGAADAAAVYARSSAPLLATVRAAAAAGCARPLGWIPAFWPLVGRHDEHLERAFRGGGANANASRTAQRADCTHYLACSSSMRLLNRLLLSAVHQG